MFALFLFVVVMGIFDYPNAHAWYRHRGLVRELHNDIDAVTKHG